VLVSAETVSSTLIETVFDRLLRTFGAFFANTRAKAGLFGGAAHITSQMADFACHSFGRQLLGPPI